MLGESQRKTFFDLLDVLTKICSDVHDPMKLDSLQLETNIVLAKVERDFPVSIQVSVYSLLFQKRHVYAYNQNDIYEICSSCEVLED